MMNPEMMKMASDMMSRMTPQQMADMQRQAASMSPDVMRRQMEMMQNMSPDQMQQAKEAASGMTPEMIQTAGGQAAAGQQQYQLSAARQLKGEGNRLHVAGKYAEAAAKYERAKSNIAGNTSAEGAELRKACRLNLASCYLNTGQPREVVLLCTEVLELEPGNRKALYRRGQGLVAVGDAHLAVPDLEASLAAAPADEKIAIAEKLEGARKAASVAGPPAGTIEEIVEEVISTTAPAPAAAARKVMLPAPSTTASSRPDQPPAPRAAAGGNLPSFGGPPGINSGAQSAQMRQMAEMMRSNPGMMANMEAMMGNLSQEQLDGMAAMSGAPRGMMTPAMAKSQMQAMRGMRPQDFEQMADMGDGTAAGAGPHNAQDAQRAAEIMKSNPELLKQSLEMMATMPQEQLDAAARAAGAPPGTRMTPETVRQMQEQLGSKTPDEIRELADQAAAAAAVRAGPPLVPLLAAAAAQAELSSGQRGASTTQLVDVGAMNAEVAAVGGMQPSTAADVFASMPPQQLSDMCGMDGGLGGLQFTPELMAASAEMMKGMSADDMQQIAAMAAAGDMPGAGGGGMQPTPEMMAQLNSPAMMGMAQRMMAGMEPQALADAMRQSGMDVTPEQAAQMKAQMNKLSPGQMAYMIWAAAKGQQGFQAARAARSYLAAHPAALIALLLLLLAVILRALGWA